MKYFFSFNLHKTMAEQNIDNFWNMCEDQLKHYTTLFNNDMGSKGFKVEYKLLDKTPIGVCYTLIMHYFEYTQHRADVLLSSMYIPQEIVLSLKELLSEIQE